MKLDNIQHIMVNNCAHNFIRTMHCYNELHLYHNDELSLPPQNVHVILNTLQIEGMLTNHEGQPTTNSIYVRGHG